MSTALRNLIQPKLLDDSISYSQKERKTSCHSHLCMNIVILAKELEKQISFVVCVRPHWSQRTKKEKLEKDRSTLRIDGQCSLKNSNPCQLCHAGSQVLQVSYINLNTFISALSSKFRLIRTVTLDQLASLGSLPAFLPLAGKHCQNSTSQSVQRRCRCLAAVVWVCMSI